MSDILYLDTETYNEKSINCGIYAYAETAEVMLFSYALNDNDVAVVDIASGELMPDNVLRLLLDKDVILYAHNSMFDRVILTYSNIFKDRPDVRKAVSDPVRWRDSMVTAYSLSLKGGLGDLCKMFNIAGDQAKDADGRQLINLFCKPRPKNIKIRRATSETHPGEWEKFKHYAKQDIIAMREIIKRMPRWNMYDDGFELDLWHLDQRINDRGVYIDVDLATKAIECIDNEQKRLASDVYRQTYGEVQTATQRDAMIKHIFKEYNVTLHDLTASTVERRLNDPDLPSGLKELLLARQQASATSTSKYKTLAKYVSSDNRLRGTLQFAGASRTGRWSGRGFQPQNLTRPTLSGGEIEVGIDAIKAGWADRYTDNIMKLTSNALRGCICAPAGKKLVVSDLSNIEGRVLAWLANETWKIQAFNDYDAGLGQDLYKISYAKSFNTDPNYATKEQRQIGKVQELALGYEGGVGAFLTFSCVYGLDLDAMADAAIASIENESLMNEAKRSYEWAVKSKRTLGLSAKAYVVCDAFKRSWRQAHPQIVNFWKLMDSGFRAIITGYHKKVVIHERLVIDKVGVWLRVKLPSGRYLCYPGARVDDQGRISYLGQNTYSRKWERILTYGGKIAENITQAVARDVMAHAMPRIENEGFNIVLTVHDEVITEVENSSYYSHEKLSQILSTPAAWANGLPLDAKGFEAYRYRKD